MTIDDRTAILIYRRINAAAVPLILGKIGDHPETERRVCRIMRWLGGLSEPLKPWVIDIGMGVPAQGLREWARGGQWVQP